MMIYLLVVGLLAVAVNAENCYTNVDNLCTNTGGTIQHCNSNYGGVDSVKPHLQQYAASHFDQNFKYLLMSTYFNSYEANREGLTKLYRKLADDAWEDGIDLIKYMAKRGFNMNYDVKPKDPVVIKSYKMKEVESLAQALDMQKLLAEQAHEIHNEIIHKNKKYNDAETVQYIEEKFVGKHAQTIRNLAGHTNDLYQLIEESVNPSLSVYLFDEQLKKTLS